MSVTNSLIQRLDACPIGTPGWSQFENICVEIITHLFEGALIFSRRQARTYSGVNRMDAIYANRNLTQSNDPKVKNWHHLFIELSARLILFEFKNYDLTDIGHEEVNQTRNYLTEPMGRLAIMICSKSPNESAHRQRNTIFSQGNEKKVILFLTKNDLKEMLWMKENGEEPSDFIVDLLEAFYIQHE